MPKGNKKGSAFEREICKQLSLWWSNGERDDIFWRTSGSGARAKTRSKKGNSTFGQYGDVQATDPIGQPLIDLCTIELKKGYSKYSFMDLIDKPENAATQVYKKFIEQAIQDSRNAKTPMWLLITKRDRRKALICFPFNFYKGLKDIIDVHFKKALHFTIIKVPSYRICIMTLNEFLIFVNPKDVKALLYD